LLNGGLKSHSPIFDRFIPYGLYCRHIAFGFLYTDVTVFSTSIKLMSAVIDKADEVPFSPKAKDGYTLQGLDFTLLIEAVEQSFSFDKTVFDPYKASHSIEIPEKQIGHGKKDPAPQKSLSIGSGFLNIHNVSNQT